ncbi:unnamed protein product, partial [Mesorhabditis belari]|uniref:G protein-coupled receptor n=1 Tax=Mesorhabditis belari TaxID=2138241 RepID=A0AAF3EL31_9BILA
MCFLVGLVPMLILSCVLSLHRDLEVSVAKIRVQYPDYNVDEWLLENRFEGMADVLNPAAIILLACAIIPNIPSVTFMFISRQRILKILEKEELCKVTKEGLRMLVKSLTMQILIPLSLCSLPVFLYMGVQFSGKQLTFLEYLIFVLICLPPAINPFITLYIMAPYKKAAKVE